MSEREKSTMVEIGGLWENEKDGNTYFSGKLNGARLLVFKNKFKKPGEKSPDWRMYVTEDKKREDKGGSGSNSSRGGSSNDEIPFGRER